MLVPALLMARQIPETPLYKVLWVDGKNVIQTDKTLANMHLKGTWDDVLAHIRMAFIGKLPDAGWLFHYTLVTDEAILRVWLGKDSYLSKAKNKREDEVSHNTLKDLIGPDFDLVVIRLGVLAHKNAAAGNVLQEALMLREAARKPTWVVELPDRPFEPGLPVYSDGLHRYLYTHFETLQCASSPDPRPVVHAPPPTSRAPSRPIEEVTLDDADFDVPGLTKQQTPPRRRGGGGHYQ